MPNLNLDEKTHIYILDDRRLISVTQALNIFDDRWKVDPFYLQRGLFIHKATELYDKNELDESTVDERIRLYLDAWVKFKIDTGFEPTHIELSLFHPTYFYAGTLDRIGFLNGLRVLIDLKSGVKAIIDPLQDAAYWELCKVNKIHIDKLFDLYLHDNGTYKLEPIEIPKRLLPVFLATLTLAKWKEGL